MINVFACLPFVAAFLSVQCLLAQNTPDPSTLTRKRFFSKIELVGGPSLSFLRGNTSVDNTFENSRKFRNGFSVGVGFSHTLKGRLELNLKFLFEEKGGISETIGTYYDSVSQSLKQGKVESNYRYDYYSLPILIDYKFGSRRQFRIGFGPFVSYLQKQVVTQKFPFFGSINTMDRTNLATKLDLGLAFKIGYNIPLNANLSLSFQILNTLGLKNTSLTSKPGQVTNSNNTSIMVGIILKN